MRNIPIKKVSESGPDLYDESVTSEKVSNWLNNFVAQMGKKVDAIQAAKARDKEAQDYSNQIRNMISNKPRFATVEDIVKDYAEKTGLNLYISKIKEAELKKKLNKSASIPDCLKNSKIDVQKYIESKIKSKNGVGVQIPAIQFDLVNVLKLKHEDVFNPETVNYINDLIKANSRQIDNKDISGLLGTSEKNNIVDDNKFLPTIDPVKD